MQYEFSARSVRAHLGGALVIGVLTTTAAWSVADVIHVPADHGSIEAALSAANDGDEIVVADGTWVGFTTNRPGPLTIRAANGVDDCRLLGASFGPAVDGIILDGFDMGRIECEGSPLIRNCVFIDHESEVTGGAIDARHTPNLRIHHCYFRGNSAIGGGAVFTLEGFVEVVGCTFVQNVAEAGGGGLYPCSTTATVVDCVFIENDGNVHGGGLLGCDDALVVNCVFSRNSADFGAGAEISNGQFINCTFSQNAGEGLSGMGDIFAYNCIFWGNEGGDISDDVTPRHSCLQSADAGWGNIVADPQFVQPGADNVRLAFDSPCIDAGLNGWLPEGLVTDLDGNPRIQNGLVDMGAYEGGYAPKAPGASEDDFDEGEIVVLLPQGGGFDPVEASAAVVGNINGGDDQFFALTDYPLDLHPDALGGASLGATLAAETTLPSGTFLAQAFVSFGIDDLDMDPTEMDLLRYDVAAGRWRLAVAGNTADSPDHDGPVGDRIVVVSEGNDYGLSPDLGDYGVFWNPSLERGFVWANLDIAADYAAGVFFPCRADCAPLGQGDDVVDAADLQAVLDAWDAPGGPCDINDDGIVDPFDIAALLDAWGQCP